MNLLVKLVLFSFIPYLLLTNSFCFAEPFAPSGSDGVDIGTALKLQDGGGSAIVDRPWLNSIGGLISTILPNVFVVAGLIIFFFILLGGFTMITNAGNPEKQKEGGQMLTGAVIGFAIIFGAYWLVQLIGLILGIDILNPVV